MLINMIKIIEVNILELFLGSFIIQVVALRSKTDSPVDTYTWQDIRISHVVLVFKI